MQVNVFPIADSFGPGDCLTGLTGDPPQPGAERRYPFDLLAASLGGGGGYGVTPEQFGAVGDGLTNDTAAFNAIQSQAFLLGGLTIRLTKGRVYAVNWTIQCNNLVIEGVDLGAEANVLAGFTAYDDSSACIIIGDATHTVENLCWNRVRVYSQARAFGMLINSLIGGLFNNCEIGGFINYTLTVRSLASRPTYYVLFNFCRFFSVAAGNGPMIQFSYGPTFVEDVTFHSCPIIGSAGTGAGYRCMLINEGCNVRVSGHTWFTCQSLKGIKFSNPTGGLNYGRLSGNCMIDGPASGTGVLVEIPSTNENTPNSFLLGSDIRVNGWMRNGAGVDHDCKGRYSFARGYLYAPRMYRPDIVGPMQLVDTSNPIVSNGPLVMCAGGPPPAVDPDGNTWTRHSIFISRNNSGSSNGVFVYTENGWENVVTGGYVGHTGPNQTIGVSPNAANTVDLSNYPGDFCYIDGAGPLRFLGNHLGTKRPEVTVSVTQDFQLQHTAYPGPGINVTGYNRNINLKIGDYFRVKNEGNYWRMLWVTTNDGRAL